MALAEEVIGVGTPGQAEHQSLFQDGAQRLVPVQNGTKHVLEMIENAESEMQREGEGESLPSLRS